MVDNKVRMIVNNEPRQQTSVDASIDLFKRTAIQEPISDAIYGGTENDLKKLMFTPKMNEMFDQITRDMKLSNLSAPEVYWVTGKYSLMKRLLYYGFIENAESDLFDVSTFINVASSKGGFERRQQNTHTFEQSIKEANLKMEEMKNKGFLGMFQGNQQQRY